MIKQLHYFKSWLLLMLCMVVGVGSANAADKTETIVLSEQGYDNAQQVSSTSGTVVTLTYTDGGTATAYYNTGTGVRVYAGGKMTITADGKTITNVSITHSKEKTPTVSFSSNGTTTASSTGTPASWEGSATSVDFNVATKGHVRIQSVEVTYEDDDPSDTRADAELSFSSSEASAIVGQQFTAPTLSTAANFNGTVEYESSNESVAQVADVETGELNIMAEGTTTITATFAGNDDYKAGSASYTLTVTDNRIATTISCDNIEINLADVANLTQLTATVKDADDNTIAYSNEGFLPEVYFESVSDEAGIIGSIDSNGEISLNSVAGTATIKAIYNYFNEINTYKPSQCTFTITVVDPNAPGTENNPYTVTDALAATPASGVYVQGTISSITEVSTQYKNATYTISDGTSEMTIYRGKYLDNADFTSEDQIAVGDIVKVYGNLAVHNNANQMAQGNYIVSLTTKPTPTITFQNGEGEDITELEVSWNETAVLTATCSAGEVELTYSSEDATIADWNGGTVSGLSEGTTNVIVSFAGNDDYKAVTATLPVTVTDTRIDVTLAFTGVPETINLNETATYTVTATPNSTAITNNVTYSSSDDNIVLVDETTGEIAALAAGTATITATFAGNNKYKEATTSYSIKVVDPSAPVEEWVLVDPSELTTGDVVVIVDQTSSKAMGNTGGTSSAPTATEVTLSTAKDKITSEVGEGIQWVVTVSGTDTKTYQFGVADTENYLYTTTSNNGLRVGPSSTNDHNVCGIYDNEGVNFITITDVENKTRYVGVYSSQDWRGYTSINTNIKDCVTAFYKKVATLPVTITTAGAASFSCGYALDFSQVPELTAYKATSKSDSYVHLDEVEQVPAGAGVIVKGAEGTYQVPVATGEVAELDGNLMVGTVNGTFTVDAADYGKVYKYVKTASGVVGFQKAKEGWTCQAGHAYLMLPTTSAREYLNIFGEEPIDDVATGINSIDNEQLTIDNDAPAYNLAGQKVGKGYKGIVVKNGKKYVK